MRNSKLQDILGTSGRGSIMARRMSSSGDETINSDCSPSKDCKEHANTDRPSRNGVDGHLGNRDGHYIGCDGRHWLAYIGLMLLFSATVTAAQETIDSEPGDVDCIVKYVMQNDSSPKYHFREDAFVLGFLPIEPTHQVLTGLNISLYSKHGKAILSVKLSSSNDSLMECYINDQITESSLIGYFESQIDFDWQHINISVENKRLVINGSYVMCPNTLVEDMSPFIDVTPTTAPIYLVQNCRQACPVFWNSVRIKPETKTNVSVANASADTHATMTHADFYNNDITSGSDVMVSYVSANWSQLYVEHNNTHIILQDEHLTNVFMTTNTEVTLEGDSMTWLVNCDSGIRKHSWKEYYTSLTQEAATDMGKWLSPVIIVLLLLILAIAIIIRIRQLRKEEWGEEESRASVGNSTKVELLDIGSESSSRCVTQTMPIRKTCSADNVGLTQTTPSPGRGVRGVPP
nr:uncharacterized protein LOC128693270 [Cherax quadricarinatus]